LQGDIHLALVCGEIDPDQPVLVRVQQADRLRDLLQIASSTASWSVHDALAAIAAAGQGVLVLIAGNEPPDATLASLARLEAVPQRRRVEQNPNVFYTVGTGSQILRDLGVRQMRLMSSPIKYNAISGFDLTVVEYLAADGRSTHLE
ncbi:MAG TPA: bifunctional 3,4-dihydroxy-2-butanone-4-phosphate synthase/GTP cyclohydrolase II, partial [Pseudomonadales bacterium]|nr:bifunctional 3,4-dihydroxy-2-butanone-4-phosphate synthase/GTP cyclohydrolase II [Pseudomonadales bacterium]